MVDHVIKGRKTNSRRHPDAFGRRPDLKELRAKEAAERQAEYDKLTPEQKLAKLDKLFGEGKGAMKTRTKLAALLSKKKVTEAQAAAKIEKAEKKAEVK